MSVDVIPAAITLYTKQAALLQAIVTGSVNRNVTWSLKSNPENAGTLTPQGWTATFSATAAGTYTAKVVSSADGSKTAIVTVYVTGNPMPATARTNKTEPVDCTAMGSGITYDVGPSQRYRTINAVPLYGLNPGDTVRIHNEGQAGSATVYNEKFNLRNSGTASEPIRICGVPNSNGDLPVIAGDNAMTGRGMDYGPIEDRGIIVVYDHRIGSATYGNGSYPKYITIEGLAIQHATTSFNYVSQAGSAVAWQTYSAAIWHQHGSHIVLRGLDIEDTSQSIFVNSQNSLGENSMSRFLLIQGNYIANNGVVSVYLQHQTYGQALGQVIQGNFYDEPKAGMLGSQIKTRCIQCFTRYNYIVGVNGGSRIFDIVGPEDSNSFVMEQEWYEQSETNIGINDVVAAADWYNTDYVYGNIVKFATAAAPVHYGDDNCAEDSHGGTLYFYHNTIWNAQASRSGTPNYRWYAFDSGPGGAPCNVTRPIGRYSQAEFTNNAIMLSSTAPVFFNWSRLNPGFVQVDKNWISTGWGTGTGRGVDGAGTAWDGIETSEYQTGNDTHHISGMGSLIAGSGIPIDSTGYSPTSGSPLIGTASALPGAVSANLPVTMQYSPVRYLMSPRTNASDIGAIQASSAAPTSLPVSKPASPTHRVVDAK